MGKEVISKYPFIHSIRYMGNKEKLLGFIVPIIEKNSKKGDTICDLMCGTSAVGYALSQRNKIIANDFEYYSSVVAKTFLNSKSIPTKEKAHKELDKDYFYNLKKGEWSFFYDIYSDTYFSPDQCKQIDSLRYSIEKNKNDSYFIYLTCLMSSMCKAQSTPGHFAQFLKKESPRVQPLRRLSIYELFFEKLNDFSSLVVSPFDNEVYNLDYKDLFKQNRLEGVSCIYLDSPYTFDQYSRFYHILETVCLYDHPATEFKAKYRNDRKQSNFCYKSKVLTEFENIIRFSSKNKSSLIISYSNHGVASVDSILSIAKKYYNNINIYWKPYNHSSQGQGDIEIKECVIELSR